MRQGYRWLTVVALASAATIGCHKNKVDGPSASVAGLTATEWELVELNGQPPKPGAGGRRASLAFDPVQGRVSGFGGCNRIAGTYRVEGDSLHFGPLISTKMACDAGMQLEDEYAKALGTTERYRLKGHQLELLVATDVVARFDPRAR